MLPVADPIPGFRAVTVVGPGTTPAGTMNVARLPVALTSVANTPPTLMRTFLAPKPLPVIVT